MMKAPKKLAGAVAALVLAGCSCPHAPVVGGKLGTSAHSCKAKHHHHYRTHKS